MNDDDRGIDDIADGVDVIDAHRDGFALLELGFATVGDDHIGLESVESLFHWIVPDRVARDVLIQCGLLKSRKDKLVVG